MRNSATDLPFLPYFLMAMASTSLYIALFSVIMMRAMMFQPGMWKFAGNRRHLVARSLSLTPPLDYTATWQRLLQDEVGTGNNSDLLIKLVSYGDAWHARQPKELKSFHHYLSHPQYTKVSGCMANVYIKLNTQDPAFPDRVCVLGAADSRVAQGLLAFMAEGLQRMSSQDVLSLSPYSLTKQLGLNQLLPVGRLNGFTNMLLLVQELLRQQEKKLLDGLVNTSSSGRSAVRLTAVSAEEFKSVESLELTSVPPEVLYAGREDEVAMLLSGGVDSSVALKLLIDQGHKVRAYYLKIWLEDELQHLNECPWEEDLKYATDTCSHLNVPLEVIPLQKEYFDYVVRYTIKEAREGRTPNPDVMCNSLIKFGMFYEYVGRFSKKIATGHYAQLHYKRDAEGNVLRAVLSPSPDRIKDQSYFLSNLKQSQLQRCVFPIGHLQKSEVRQLAEQFDLPTKHRRDSQGICFLGKLSFDQFIAHYMGEKSGEIRDYHTNQVIGKHKGLWYHTIGQRKGVGLLLSAGYVHQGPYYVADKDVDKNVLLVTNNYQVIDEPRRRFVVKQINWIDDMPEVFANNPDEPVRLLVKLRHGPSFLPCSVHATRDTGNADGYCDSDVHSRYGSIDNVTLRVLLDEKDKGIAPGQFAVFYHPDNLRTIVGGTIALHRP